MTILILSLLSVLIVCDLLLVYYCKVKQTFSLFAFRFFIILLTVVSLIMTGDINIALG